MSTLRQLLLAGLRRFSSDAGDRPAGLRGRRLMGEIVRRHPRRHQAFLDALDLVNFERVEGDVAELGVFTGISLALLAHCASHEPQEPPRSIVGFDSFAGLPGSAEEHASWGEGDCATNHGWHPLLPLGAPVTPAATLQLFEALELPVPRLEVGPFEETVAAAVAERHRKLAVVHFDCDLYESTATALAAIEPALQEGTVLLFDDWFHYRGNPGKGEARALAEFLECSPVWGANPYRSYATFGKAFILYRRDAASPTTEPAAGEPAP